MNSMKRNGYLKPPLVDTQKGECFICGYQGDTVVHEVFYGTANRKLSKEWGCYVHICVPCHQAIHTNPDCKYADDALKKTVYDAFCRKYGRDKFKEIFGRYYDD